MAKINLLKKNLLDANIQDIQYDEYNFWILFSGDMRLTVYSKYKILGSSKEDYSDLIWLKITKYQENKDSYLLTIWKIASIEISRKEEDWEYEILQLNVGGQIIVVNES